MLKILEMVVVEHVHQLMQQDIISIYVNCSGLLRSVGGWSSFQIILPKQCHLVAHERRPTTLFGAYIIENTCLEKFL